MLIAYAFGKKTHNQPDMLSLDTIKTVAKRTALIVLVADIYHCYTYMSNYYAEADTEETEEEKLAAEREIYARYSGDCDEQSVVSKQDFELRVQKALDDMTAAAAKQNDHDVLEYRIHHPSMKINRESVAFLGGGRATFLQLAHPFIAAGIRDHSYLQNGVSRRFYNTFKYVFGLTYGTNEEIVSAARGVRALHNKVNGPLQEDVGVFSAKSRFDANQKDAMRYVQWTLVETAVFEYELHVGWLSEKEKDEIARYSAKFLLLFGVPEEDIEANITWKQFKRRVNAMYRSKLTTVSDTALDTAEFLLLPPGAIYSVAMNALKWSTLISLPPNIAQQFGGRRYDTQLDLCVFALSHGIVRFFYRLAPGSFRYVSKFWQLHERRYGERNVISRMLSTMSATMTTMLIKLMMPDRDPEAAIQAVKAARAQQIPFDKTQDKPLEM